VVVYLIIFSFGIRYIYNLLREGPQEAAIGPSGATPMRPMAFADETSTGGGIGTRK
jgi:cytochrome d ubiquinol oxidase subunit I